MSIAARCLHCAQKFSAPDALAGKRVKCPKCAAPVTVAHAVISQLDEPELEVLEDEKPVVQRPQVVASAPVSPRPAALSMPKSFKRPNFKQLVPYAPAIELVGAVCIAAGIFGWFAHSVLHYEATWGNLGILSLFGGTILFVLAQIVEYDGERFGRAICLILFFGVTSALVGAGVEIGTGRMTADALKFWETDSPEALVKDLDALNKEFIAVMQRVTNLETAQQNAETLRDLDERMVAWQARSDKCTARVDRKRMDEIKAHFRKQKEEIGQVISKQFRIIAQSPNGGKALRVIGDSLSKQMSADPNSRRMFDSAIALLESTQRSGKLVDASAVTGGQGTNLASPLNTDRSQQVPAQASPTSATNQIASGTEPQEEFLRDEVPSDSDAHRDDNDADAAMAARLATSDPGKSLRAMLGRGFREQAGFEFRFNRDAAGQAMLQAAALSGSDEALTPQLQYCPALKRPAFSLFWGIGVTQEAIAELPPPNERWKSVRRPLTERGRDSGFWQISDFKRRTGDVGMGLAEGLQNRIEQREFGDWGSEFERTHFELRGLALFEMGQVSWTMQKAREQGVDLLFVLHLQDKRAAAGPYTELQIDLLRVSDGKSLWQSEPLSDRKLIAERRKGKDLAADLVATAFAFTDKQVRLVNMPTIKPDAARKRAAKLASDAAIEPLTALLEIRYYQVQGLISADEAEEFYAKKVKKDLAHTLATGDEDARSRALVAYLSR